MTQNRPQTNISQIKGSTADILLQLYNVAHNVQLPKTDPILRKCVIVDAQMAQTRNTLREAANSPIERHISDIQTNIDRMPKNAADHKLGFTNELAPLKDSANKLVTQEQAQSKEFSELLAANKQALSNLVTDYRDGKKSLPQLLNSLNQFTTVIRGYLANASKLRQAQVELEQSQTNLFAKTVRLLPPAERDALLERENRREQPGPSNF
jgi:septal ring factor EnvC (AmiA/AmiB activator)